MRPIRDLFRPFTKPFCCSPQETVRVVNPLLDEMRRYRFVAHWKGNLLEDLQQQLRVVVQGGYDDLQTEKRLVVSLNLNPLQPTCKHIVRSSDVFTSRVSRVSASSTKLGIHSSMWPLHCRMITSSSLAALHSASSVVLPVNIWKEASCTVDVRGKSYV